MKIKIINKPNFELKYFNYKKYCDWLDEIAIDRLFFGICTFTYKVRPKSEWNINGREIYNKQNIYIHAKKVFEILKALNLSNFLVRHEYNFFPWLPITLNSNEFYNEKKQYLNKILNKTKIENFIGMLEIKDIDLNFIENLLDYPFLLKYHDIDLVSFDSDLLIKFTHHLGVDFVSQDKDIIENIIELCKNINLNYIRYK